MLGSMCSWSRAEGTHVRGNRPGAHLVVDRVDDQGGEAADLGVGRGSGRAGPGGGDHPHAAAGRAAAARSAGSRAAKSSPSPDRS